MTNPLIEAGARAMMEEAWTHMGLSWESGCTDKHKRHWLRAARAAWTAMVEAITDDQLCFVWCDGSEHVVHFGYGQFDETKCSPNDFRAALAQLGRDDESANE